MLVKIFPLIVPPTTLYWVIADDTNSGWSDDKFPG